MRYRVTLPKNGYEVYEVEASSKGEALEKIYYNPDEYLVDDDEKWFYEDVEITEITNEV